MSSETTAALRDRLTQLRASRRPRLELTSEAYDGLHRAIDRLRNAVKVTVERDALAALLRDHAAILAYLKAEG